LWKFLNKDKLKWIRLAFAIIDTLTGIFDSSVTGWVPFLWYYADWALFLTITTQWLLVAVHFFPFNAKLNNFVHSFYQAVLPMCMSITLLYWKFFYTHGSMHFNNVNTYVHPFFLYIVPAFLLLVEYVLDSIIFEYKKLALLMILYLVYLPFTWLGKFVLGYWPYPFITWNTWYSYGLLLALALL